MSFFRKIGNAVAQFMYGRNGLDQFGVTLIWICLLLDIISRFALRASVVAGTILYWGSMILWIWTLFRMFSKNLYKRREENARFLAVFQNIRIRNSSARARHADRTHKYFTCKHCKTICRVPMGQGKVIITCPKCGAKIHGKT